MKKKKLITLLEKETRQLDQLRRECSNPSEVSVAIRGQLIVIDFPKYPGRGESMRLRGLVSDGMAEVKSGKLPIDYAESCKQELLYCLLRVEETIQQSTGEK